MGAWGAKIFEDDTALDIKDTYREAIIVGSSDEEAEEMVVREFLEEGSALWLPLAITEWKVGRLSNRVKEAALLAIDSELEELEGPDVLWKKSFIPRRKAELQKAKAQLLSPTPARKTLRMPWYAWKCPWPVGSVLQYHLQYPLEDNPFRNQYILVQIVGISEEAPNKIPTDALAVRLFNWHSPVEPITIQDKIAANPPEFLNFRSQFGNTFPRVYLSFTKDELKREQVKCVSKTPYAQAQTETFGRVSSQNNLFDDWVVRALKSAQK